MKTRSEYIATILNLRARAKDQAGTPEGETSKKIAERLMKKHSITEDEIRAAEGKTKPGSPEFDAQSDYSDALSDLLNQFFGGADEDQVIDRMVDIVVQAASDEVSTEELRVAQELMKKPGAELVMMKGSRFLGMMGASQYVEINDVPTKVSNRALSLALTLSGALAIKGRKRK